MGNIGYLASTYCTPDGCHVYRNGACFALLAGRRRRKNSEFELTESPDPTLARSPACGPIVGCPLGARQFRVWARGRGAKYQGQNLMCTLVVQTFTKSGSRVGLPLTATMREKDDFVAAVTVVAPAGAEMYYKCAVVQHHPLDRFDAHAVKFEPMPMHTCVVPESSSTSSSIIFGSCKWVGKDGLREPVLAQEADVVFKTIQAQLDAGVATHGFFMLGDNIYADDLHLFDADDTFDEFVYNYRNSFKTPAHAKIMATLPTIMQADDHDFWNNFSADQAYRKGFSPDAVSSDPVHTQQFIAAKRAYELYQKPLNPSYGKQHHWFTCEVGLMNVFVLDVRLERRNKVSPRVILSESQLDALTAWLLNQPSAAVKVVATGVPFLPEMSTPDPEPHGSDTWNGYPEQRDKIFKFIKDKRIQNVVFISGDLHCGFSCAVDCGGVRVLQLVSSPWYFPFGKRGVNILPLKVGDIYTTLADSTEVRLTHMSKLIEVDQFGRLTVDNDNISFKIYSRELKEGTTQKLLDQSWPVQRLRSA